VQAALRYNGGQTLAQASDAKAVYAAPVFSYALTTTSDPVAPGQVAQFTATLTDLRATAQFATITFHVPTFTTYRGYAAGTAYDIPVYNVAPGASVSVNIDPTVLGGDQSPPDGSLITVVAADLARGAEGDRGPVGAVIPNRPRGKRTEVAAGLGTGWAAEARPSRLFTRIRNGLSAFGLTFAAYLPA
jgi:hypothetical protein